VSCPDEPPTRLRPVTVEISRFWTAEVALAVFELVDDLRDRILALHGDQIRDLLKEQRGYADPGLDLDSGDDSQSF
jgi:hypothetical protein